MCLPKHHIAENCKLYGAEIAKCSGFSSCNEISKASKAFHLQAFEKKKTKRICGKPHISIHTAVHHSMVNVHWNSKAASPMYMPYLCTTLRAKSDCKLHLAHLTDSFVKSTDTLFN